MTDIQSYKKIIEPYNTKDSVISILIRKINGETFFDQNSTIKVNSASCIKVAIMIAILKKVELKEISLNEDIIFKNSTLIGYSGIYNEVEKHASLLELLTFMIINSDNLATNVLIDLFSFDYYNDYFKEIGLVDTELNRYMGVYNLNKENYTSNKDMFYLFKKLFRGQLFNNELSSVAKSILIKQRSKNASQRYISSDIEVYHKTGGLSYLNLRNDCGCFKLNGEFYYFGFFTEKMLSKEAASILIGKLFKKIFNDIK